MENKKISKLVRNQLPDFVRSEYGVFVTFLEKYYEWMEQNSNPLGAIEHLKNSLDIDTASDEYIESIYTNLLPYFPQGMIGDKRIFLKHLNDFYSRKGSEESLKLAFRSFYGEDSEVYYPKENILKVSDGKWLLPLALRIDSDDLNFLNIEKTLLTGTTSKATAIVEKITKSVDRQLGIEYIEVYISNIEKYFETGEIVTATYYDTNDLPVTVEGRLVGALSEIKVNPSYRGLYYTGYDADVNYDGDPVTIVGGLNPVSAHPIGAKATVGDVSKGSVVDILTVNGGLGFRLNDVSDSSYAKTVVDFKGGHAIDSALQSIKEAKAEITLLDQDVSRNVSITNTTIQTYYDKSIANVANIYGTIVNENTADPSSNSVNTLSQYESLTLYPISFVQITGGGGGYKEKPGVDVYSFYNSNLGETIIGTESSPKIFSVLQGSKTLTTSYTGLISVYNIEKGHLLRFVDTDGRTENIKEVESVTEIGINGDVLNSITVTEPFPAARTNLKAYKLNKSDIRDIGALGRLEIVDGGEKYNVGDILVFSGGSGYGANANVTSVSGLGTITGVDFQYHSSNAYVRGGEGYSMKSLPSVSVINTNGSVAGDGNASIRITEILGDGEELDLSTSQVGSISTLRITSYGYDYVTAPRISLRNMDMTVSNVQSGLLFVSNTRVYQGTSNSTTTFSAYVDQYDPSKKFLRLFDYQGTISNTKLLISDDGLISANVDSFIVYGDGKARATATFENGLIRLPGIYINNDGHVSSDKYIQDGDKYHNFSYIVNTDHDYIEYKKPFREVFHPAGMKNFMSKTTYIEDNMLVNANSSLITVRSLEYTSFNISNNSNTIISTNSSINLTSSVNVGDVIILTGINKVLSGSANVVNTSNVVSGLNSKYINDLNDDDLIILSTYESNNANSSYIVTSETVNLKSNTNDITTVFTQDLINYYTGQYVPQMFKSFIEQKIDDRMLGDIADNGSIDLSSVVSAVNYQQNVAISSTETNWISNYIIPRLMSSPIYNAYWIYRTSGVSTNKLYFIADKVVVNSSSKITLTNPATVTANNLFIKLIYNDMTEVVNVTSNTIVVKDYMHSNSNNIPVILHKLV